jgi:hypothetical protein
VTSLASFSEGKVLTHYDSQPYDRWASDVVVLPYLYERRLLGRGRDQKIDLLINGGTLDVEIEFLCSEIRKLRGITSNMLTFDLAIS